ncbi:MAG: NAD-dependent epimerase/dehydratase family protein [Thermomicrobiales bacterium]
MPEQTNTKQRILVTGADGLIGRMVIDAWRDHPGYETVGLARKPGAYTDVLADIADLDAIRPAFDGIDAVVHLAATSAVASSWDDVLPSTLVGTYPVFEAARLAGVERVVFASSNHAIGTNETENQPDLYELEDPRVWDETAGIKPDSLYGVSKAYGEALARYYVDHHGLRAFCLRIGGTRSKDDPTHPDNLWKPEFDNDPEKLKTRTRMRAVWLSERDCVQLIERCLDSDERWFLGYGISDNPRKFWDIEHAKKVLGYAPEDGAPDEIIPDHTGS